MTSSEEDVTADLLRLASAASDAADEEEVEEGTADEEDVEEGTADDAEDKRTRKGGKENDQGGEGCK